MVGGVACNGKIREAIVAKFGKVDTFFPSPILCTDNAAMIAKAGVETYIRGGRRAPLMQPTSEISRPRDSIRN